MILRRIILCGFSGAGKSQFLEKMESSPFSSAFAFYDLDELICQSCGENPGKIATLVERIGWEGFREKENEIFKQYLKEPVNLLLALGGGSLNEDNVDFLRKDKSNSLVWLNTTFEDCWNRIKDDQGRPLAKRGKEELLKLYQQRCSLYKKADIQLSPNDQLDIQNMSDLFRHCGFFEVS